MQFTEMHILSTLLHLIVLVNHSTATSETFSKAVRHISGVLPNISDLPIKNPIPQVRCLRLQCRYICFNGKAANIERDIQAVEDRECLSIDELHLYSYDFPKETIPNKFLGNISNYVKHLAIYASNVVSINDGAFESETLIGVHLENLQLNHIQKGIFENITEKFTEFTLIQKGILLKYVDESFLEYVKYQIKRLTIQTGLITVKNLTNSDCLLNTLEDVNLSYNNFDDRLTSSGFKRLSMVERLNLTHSEISFLPETIFSDILGTLKMLDLSNNKLTVISQNIFGWRDFRKDLEIYFNGNPWECTCDLQQEMLNILIYQTEKVYCATPEGVQVKSSSLCASGSSSSEYASDSNEINSGGGWQPFPPIAAPTEAFKTTQASIVPTEPGSVVGSSTDKDGLARLECQKEKENPDTEQLSVQWPGVQFDIVEKEGFEVDIVVTEALNGTYGILWFSKVTTQYYKMEVNYKEYGLGCYGFLQYVTTVYNLLPDTSYTFCLVLKDQLTVSPFSCKSVYIGGNLDINYSAWLTTNMKATGITMVVLGIVLFNFIGTLTIFLLIKQKPFLLKGSKRVAMQKNDSTNIIVFPEDKMLEKFKEKEEQIAKKNSTSSSFRRLSSVSITSLDSNQSYMNPVKPNLYEVIPAYQCYLPTFSSMDVGYAEIPLRRKRTSNDPLPAVPCTSNASTPVLTMKEFEINRDLFLDTEGSSV